ncbi:XRE family transcriptional regulator [Fibrella forsythiae]|uniref:HTH cro/C1-type domain-containing protein n=1 Tax=Fibrella forsythiae TaxID=2817061 RepID=A0ABS3JLH4_9BACT|nr:hypothetical protein [Fibrella forsythiae]MBO0950854.1 hypothetical protein [Fibrella forsythiae]
MQNKQNSISETDYVNWFTEAFKALEVTASEVAKRIGVDNAKIYNILNGKFKPGYGTIQEILTAYPRLNANYLMTGKLPILHNSGAEVVGTGLIYIYLPVIVPPNDASMNNETYPVLLRENNKDNLADCVVFRVTDSSMSPSFRPSTVLLARTVPIVDWEYLNSVLVAVSYRSVLVIRRVKENDLLTKGYLTLYADNEQAGYVHVKREDINSIWRVLEIVGGGVE